MKYYSLIGSAHKIRITLEGAKVSNAIGMYNGELEPCTLVQFDGPLAANQGRRKLNAIAFAAGEQCVLHVSDGIATLEYPDGGWLVSTTIKHLKRRPRKGDFVKLSDAHYIQVSNWE